MMKNIKLSTCLFSLTVLIIFAGLFVAAWLFNQSYSGMYPVMIADVFRETQHLLTVPGSREVNLTRPGAYGIYYESNLVAANVKPSAELPAAIVCSLVSPSLDTTIQAVPDYAETNRYRSKQQGKFGVLIMSLNVEDPGTYTFTCDYKERRTEPEITVALGPNYLWEFLRVVGKIGLPLFGGISILCGSLLLAFLLLVAGFVFKVLTAPKSGTQS